MYIECENPVICENNTLDKEYPHLRHTLIHYAFIGTKRSILFTYCANKYVIFFQLEHFSVHLIF